MKQTTSDNIQLGLIDNGLDFVTSGLENILKDRSPHLLKYAILHLSSGTELILKEFLKNEHWSLIFENPNNAKLELLNKGEFKSVDFETLLIRLKNICEIGLSDKDISILRQLRRLRNKIEHFECCINEEAIKSLSSKVLSLLLNFINENLETSSLSNISKADLDNLRCELIKFKDFVTLRTAQINSDLTDAQKDYNLESCPLCRQSALILNNDLKCLFCGYSDEAEIVAELYAENILGESKYICMTDGGEFPVTECIHCGADTFVDKGLDGYVCFSCFETNEDSDLKNCTICGQLFESKNEENEKCEYCVDYIMYKND